MSYNKRAKDFRQAPKGKRHITPNEGHNCWCHPPLVGYPRRNFEGKIVLDVQIRNKLIEFKRIYKHCHPKEKEKIIRTTFVIHDKYDQFEMEEHNKMNEA